MSAQIPAGPWFGHLTYAGALGGLRAVHLSLELDGGRIVGRGHDVEGDAAIEGARDPDGTVRWVSRTDSGPWQGLRMAFLGGWDGTALSGRFRAVDRPEHGTFLLRPGVPEDLVDDAQVQSVLSSAGRHRDQVGIDLEAVRFDGERDMLRQLAEDPAFVAALRGGHALDQVANLDAEPPPGLFPRYRLTPRTVPIAFQALDRCREVLGLTAPVELYVENGGHLNAYVEETREGVIRITFTSAVFDRLDVEEITGIVGHELGHALLGHLGTRVVSDADLSGVVQLRRLALARYQELSADRVGLLCTGDAALAVRTEFLLHTGITRTDRIGSAEQIERTAREAVASARPTDEAGYDTHPAGAYRTLALATFGRSAPFYQLRGQVPPADALSEAELEAEVAALVSALNPAVMDATACDAEIDELVALVGLAVAGADSRTTKRETQAIRSLSPGVSAAFDRVAALPFERRQLAVVDLAEKLSVALSPQTRARIVEDLTMIAQVDGHLSPPELEVLDGISVLLAVPSGCPGALLAELQGGLD